MLQENLVVKCASHTAEAVMGSLWGFQKAKNSEIYCPKELSVDLSGQGLSSAFLLLCLWPLGIRFSA